MKTSPSLLPRLPAVALSALALSACGQATEIPHNLGNTIDDENTADEGDTGEPPAAFSASDFTGVWIGEAEDPLASSDGAGPAIYQFPSGSTQIRIDYATNDEGVLVNPRITFGEATTPPTFGGVGYPAGTKYRSGIASRAAVLPPVEGFQYVLWASGELVDTVQDTRTLLDEGVQDGIIHFSYLANAAFDEWCSGQLPFPIVVPGINVANPYNCAGNFFGWFPIDDPTVPNETCTYNPYDPEMPDVRGPDRTIDCWHVTLCDDSSGPICSCIEQGCLVSSAMSELTLRRDGDELVGTFSLAVFFRSDWSVTTLGAVRFRRE